MDFYETMLQQKLAGGGGDENGDFSTASLIVNGEGSIDGCFAVDIPTEAGLPFEAATMTQYVSNSSISLILYKGSALITIRGDYVVNGNIQVFDSGICLVTGDCTITFQQPNAS